MEGHSVTLIMCMFSITGDHLDYDIPNMISNLDYTIVQYLRKRDYILM